MSIFCKIGLHNYLEIKWWSYSEKHKKSVLVDHRKECCNCEKVITYV